MLGNWTSVMNESDLSGFLQWQIQGHGAGQNDPGRCQSEQPYRSHSSGCLE